MNKAVVTAINTIASKDGTTISYTVTGSGPGLVVVPGQNRCYICWPFCCCAANPAKKCAPLCPRHQQKYAKQLAPTPTVAYIGTFMRILCC